MNQINQKLINAIIRKADRICPESLLLIGVYGSYATGDLHSKSDLDLLILIRDERGRQLADGFVLDDVGIGYDIYCTTWEMLERDAQCDHAQLSKLLDSKIVYVNDPSSVVQLEELRNKAKAVLVSDQRKEKAKAAFESAKNMYADCLLAESFSQVRTNAGAVIHYLLDAVMLYHGQYFRKGVKRTFEEVSALTLPFDMEALVMAVICADNAGEIRTKLTALMRSVRNCMESPGEKEMPGKSNLKGTYEEMFSNWRNKMQEAAQNDDLYSSFMNMVSFQFMLQDIGQEVSIRDLDAMADFDVHDIKKNANLFDDALCQYREEYKNAGIEPNVFSDIDAFLEQY